MPVVNGGFAARTGGGGTGRAAADASHSCGVCPALSAALSCASVKRGPLAGAAVGPAEVGDTGTDGGGVSVPAGAAESELDDARAPGLGGKRGDGGRDGAAATSSCGNAPALSAVQSSEIDSRRPLGNEGPGGADWARGRPENDCEAIGRPSEPARNSPRCCNAGFMPYDPLRLGVLGDCLVCVRDRFHRRQPEASILALESS